MNRSRLGAFVLAVAMVTAAPLPSPAECQRLPLRVFTPAEREQLETRYGVNWWRVLGLIPGPSTPDDYVERPSGDSSIRLYSPQQFWDPRGCRTDGARETPASPR